MECRRVFKVRAFERWMRKTSLTDAALCAAVDEMAAGLIDANLGGGVLKKRVAMPGRGKSGGFRTLIATNQDDRWFYVLGFEKAERGNIDAEDVVALKALASELLRLTSTQLDGLLEGRKLVEICHDREEQQEAWNHASESIAGHDP